MGRRYTVHIPHGAVTVAQDLLEINAPADAVVRLEELHLSQTTEFGDAQEEQLGILIKSGATTSGSGGASATPSPNELGDAAFGGTCEINNTTKATAGTIVTHATLAWNVRMPLDVIFTPENRKPLSPSGRLTAELTGAPADSITMGGYAVFEELGG